MDASNGVQVIAKILASSSLQADTKSTMIESVRKVLQSFRQGHTPPYRLLLEIVGLPVPAGPSPFSRTYPNQQPQSQGGYYTPSPQHAQGYHRQNQSSPSPQPNAYGNGMTGPNLSPLLIPQNMALGQMRNGGGPPNSGMGGKMMGMNIGGMGGSPQMQPRTPQAIQRGRLSPGPGSHMMSPGSDPFNPVRSHYPSELLFARCFRSLYLSPIVSNSV
jgi:protein JSN1